MGAIIWAFLYLFRWIQLVKFNATFALRFDIFWNLSPLNYHISDVKRGEWLFPCDDAALRGVEPEAALDGGDDDVGEDHALHDGRQTQARQQPPRAQPQGRPPVGWCVT